MTKKFEIEFAADEVHFGKLHHQGMDGLANFWPEKVPAKHLLDNLLRELLLSNDPNLFGGQ